MGSLVRLRRWSLSGVPPSVTLARPCASRPAPLEGPGCAVHGTPVRRAEGPLDLRLFPPHPPVAAFSLPPSLARGCQVAAARQPGLPRGRRRGRSGCEAPRHPWACDEPLCGAAPTPRSPLAPIRVLALCADATITRCPLGTLTEHPAGTTLVLPAPPGARRCPAHPSNCPKTSNPASR